MLRNLCMQPAVAVEPNNPEVLRILNSLAGLDLNRVMAKRREPLVVPHYQLMTLEQLQQVQKGTQNRTREILQPPPILPERLPCGEVIEVDENLAGAIDHRMIFTETSQHKENQLRSIVVREPDGVLRQATWEERDRMCQVFFPALGRRIWLPKALSDEVLPSILENLLHVNVLDLVCVQCDPQSSDYHRVHKCVYEDVEIRKCYDLLRSTRYFASMVWHLLTFSDPPRVYGLLKDMLERGLLDNATELIRLFVLCFPENNASGCLQAQLDVSIVEEFCKHSNFYDLLPLIEPCKDNTIASFSSIYMS